MFKEFKGFPLIVVALWTILATFLLSTSIVFAAVQRTTLKDLDNDGFKESKDTFEGSVQVLNELDRNKDGKTDRTTHYINGIQTTSEEDRDFNGRIDTWVTYNSEGATAFKAKDTNADGKPDSFQKMIKDPAKRILKEDDTNFDGRIDRRRLVEWMMIRYVPGGPKTPGYRSILYEEDTNFDGKIDKYREKGRKDANEKIGSAIDSLPAQIDPEKLKSAAGSGEGSGVGQGKRDTIVDIMNKRYGLTDN